VVGFDDVVFCLLFERFVRGEQGKAGLGQSADNSVAQLLAVLLLRVCVCVGAPTVLPQKKEKKAENRRQKQKQKKRSQ
jgi:hypothetical protein